MVVGLFGCDGKEAKTRPIVTAARLCVCVFVCMTKVMIKLLAAAHIILIKGMCTTADNIGLTDIFFAWLKVQTAEYKRGNGGESEKTFFKEFVYVCPPSFPFTGKHEP